MNRFSSLKLGFNKTPAQYRQRVLGWTALCVCIVLISLIVGIITGQAQLLLWFSNSVVITSVIFLVFAGYNYVGHEIATRKTADEQDRRCVRW